MKLTVGDVYPLPPAFTVTAVTDPLGSKVAVAAASMPDPLISTFGADVYPLPGFVMVMPVIDPSAPTVAVAVAPLPPPPMISTVASGNVNGLLAQFGLGPK
jgi:hypothetical protein